MPCTILFPVVNYDPCKDGGSGPPAKGALRPFQKIGFSIGSLSGGLKVEYPILGLFEYYYFSFNFSKKNSQAALTSLGFGS
jgi:hypothetical protein